MGRADAEFAMNRKVAETVNVAIAKAVERGLLIVFMVAVLSPPIVAQRTDRDSPPTIFPP